MAFMQQNAIRSRIVESFAILQSGLIPTDFVGKSELERILSEVETQIKPELKLAFGQDNVKTLYNLPIANPAMLGDQTFIEIRLPLVRRDRKQFEFDMISLKSYPFLCLS